MHCKFCTQCGNPVGWCIPKEDTHHRYVCNQCGFVHYQNPKVVAGCVVYKDNQVLLCKRAIEPRLGLWTLPAGFMEIEETTRQAAERETQEETGASIKADGLFAITNSPHVSHINIYYLAKLEDGCIFHPTNESSEVKLFTKEELPWNNIAFHTVKLVLQWFFNDLEGDHFTLHEIDFPVQS